MLKRNWGLIIALGLAVLVSILLWVQLRPRQPDLPRYQQQQPAVPNYQPGGSACQLGVLSAIRDQRQAERERGRCAEQAEDYRLQSNDLVQQTRAADAAQAQTDLAAQMAWMGLYGTIGGFLTLLAAGMAAFYAREAARHADAGVSETRRIGETQSRAYLSVIRADIQIGRREPMFTGHPSIDVFLHFHNSGATPAVNISYHCMSAVTKSRDIETLPPIDTVPYHRFVNNIPPAQTSRVDATCFGVARDWREVVQRWDRFTIDTPIGDAPALLIHGVVFYEDVYGDTFRSQFIFWLEEQPMPNRPPRGKDDLPTIQARVPTFEPITDRLDYIVPPSQERDGNSST